MMTGWVATVSKIDVGLLPSATVIDSEMSTEALSEHGPISTFDLAELVAREQIDIASKTLRDHAAVLKQTISEVCQPV